MTTQTDGQRIAGELERIRELLEGIAGALFAMADAAEGQQDDEDEQGSAGQYLDGTPIR